MGNTHEPGQPTSQELDDLASAFDAAFERALTAPSPAWHIRPPRDMADYRAGRFLPGMSFPGGDIPCRWIPPEYADLDDSPEAES
jgi:hypothetical protein